MKVRRLFFGSMDSGKYLGESMPFNGYIIWHPDGIVLVDTGFGHQFGPGESGTAEGFAPDLGIRWIARTTRAALADHYVKPEEVKFVINTHLLDHAGDNYMFPNATFIVQRPELELAREGQVAQGVEKPESLQTEPFDFPGANFQFIDQEDKEVLPGITCLFTPGHTSGHQSVLVDTGDRKELIVGDAVYTAAIWEDLDLMNPDHPAWIWQVMTTGELWRASAEKLKALDVDLIHFAHDPKILGWESFSGEA